MEKENEIEQNELQAKCLDEFQYGSHLRVYKPLIKKFGLPLAAVLCNYVNIYSYWLEYNKDFNGTIQITFDSMARNVGLPEDEIRKLTEKLIEIGMIKSNSTEGGPAKKPEFLTFDFTVIKQYI